MRHEGRGAAAARALLVATLVATLLAGCESGEDVPRAASRTAAGDSAAAPALPEDAQRWYSRERVERGAVVFAENCAECHGKDASGAFAWTKRDANGNFPPPPLDGTAHAWHHPIVQLAARIREGAPRGMGTMPGFGGALTDEQVLDAIAWFQDRWPDDIYAKWTQIERRARGAP